MSSICYTVGTMTTKTKGARIITLEELPTLRYPLPASWKKAAGMLRGRKIDPVKYQRQIRAEWEKRLKRQYHLGTTRPHHDDR